jgi:ribonuclease HI
MNGLQSSITFKDILIKSCGNIGFSNILHAELLVVYHGLVLAWGLENEEIWCYSDSKTVIKLITDPVNA